MFGLAFGSLHTLDVSRPSENKAKLYIAMGSQCKVLDLNFNNHRVVMGAKNT